MRRSWMTILLVMLAAASAFGQSWSSAYESAMQSARSGKWTEARERFKQAIAYRTEDVAGPTTMPGPATEQRRWRNGAPYSPNFLAAYAGYRAAMDMNDVAGQTSLLNEVANELEALLGKSQFSHASFYYLGRIYVKLNDTAKRLALEKRYDEVFAKADWKVDMELVAPEDVAAIQEASKRNSTGMIRAEDLNNRGTGQAGTNPTTPVAPAQLTNPISSRVREQANKYALIIGNSESKMTELAVPFASDDAQRVRESMIGFAGYPEANVDLVINATAEQMMSSAKALAERIPADATVMIYFSGVGANIDGKDFLAGVDCELSTDTSKMVAKAEIYRLFMAKGARVFAFFEANRPIVAGRYFGMEVPLVGSIAQVQATMPGDVVYGISRNGKTIGVFTEAMTGVISDLRSSTIPILEFGWQVFYRIRRGDTGRTGGGSRQTPTLPVLTNMASDAKF